MKRNDARNAYPATAAHTHADAQYGRPKATRFEQDPAMAAHVKERPRALDSPMTIAVELSRGVYPGRGHGLARDHLQRHLRPRPRRTRERTLRLATPPPTLPQAPPRPRPSPDTTSRLIMAT